MMPAKGLRSSVDVMTEYHVLTECGRNLAEYDFDIESLRRRLKERNYKPELIETIEEYEANLAAYAKRAVELDKMFHPEDREGKRTA
ncbi:hypothetical protein [Paenibacillus peoriae]|uniref:hypothetical protein n=2 Tax=Paenibacillus TaxID=44249 RepID=UPI0032B012AC